MGQVRSQRAVHQDETIVKEHLGLSSMKEVQERLDALRANLTTVIHGKQEPIDILIVALLAGGSILMEDVPGVGKTTLAKALARSIDLQFHRVQFTPDLLPADILGSSIYSPKSGEFTFRSGPIFCNVLLADEINRASPRTQSALLEAMSERQATIEGTSHALPSPFLVLATQNPVDFHGTYPLPEAQLDRFLVQLDLGYPDPETEVDILYSQALQHPLDGISAVLTTDDLIDLQRQVCDVRVDRSVGQYMIDIVAATRADSRLKLGVSPRGSLMLFRASQAAALSAGRDYVVPGDVQRLVVAVLAHRVIMTSKARYGNLSKGDVLREILQHVKVPT